MDRRIALDDELKAIAARHGGHVYYQPPSTVKMTYPAIRYTRARLDVIHADNKPYRHHVGYEVTVIDRNPDSEIVKELIEFPMGYYNRHYFAENLNHDVFIIYY